MLKLFLITVGLIGSVVQAKIKWPRAPSWFEPYNETGNYSMCVKYCH